MAAAPDPFWDGADFIFRLIQRIAEPAPDEGPHPSRLEPIVDRLLPPSESRSPVSAADHVPLSTARLALAHAVRHLPPEKAVPLFRRADRDELVGCWVLLLSLLTSDTFLTIDELADVVEEFADHLTANRPSLVKDGVPHTTLGYSWPGALLSYVYPTKAIAEVASQPVDQDHRTDSPRRLAFAHLPATKLATEHHRYSWIREDASHLADPPSGEDLQTMPALWCQDPAQALRIPDLDVESAQRLEQARASLLRLEMDMLRHVASALRRGDPDALWNEAVQLLVKSLPAKDAVLYLTMDRVFYGQDIAATGDAGGGWLRRFRGGLSNLLFVIGYAEKELRVGTMDRTKRHLPLAVFEGDASGAYFRSVDQPGHAQLDGVLDQHLQLLVQEFAFWQGYQERITQVMTEELRGDVTVSWPELLPLKYVAAFETHIQSIGELSASILEHTGRLPVIQQTLQFMVPADPITQSTIDRLAVRGERPPAGRPPGLTNVSAEEFKERLPGIYADVSRRFGPRPTNLQLADEFCVSVSTFKRYLERYKNAGGRWPPPLPNN